MYTYLWNFNPFIKYNRRFFFLRRVWILTNARLWRCWSSNLPKSYSYEISYRDFNSIAKTKLINEFQFGRWHIRQFSHRWNEMLSLIEFRRNFLHFCWILTMTITYSTVWFHITAFNGGMQTLTWKWEKKNY